MVVYVPDDGRGVPRLCRAEQLDALSVRVPADSRRWDLLSRSLAGAGAGAVADDHAWLDVEPRRPRPGAPSDVTHGGSRPECRKPPCRRPRHRSRRVATGATRTPSPSISATGPR